MLETINGIYKHYLLNAEQPIIKATTILRRNIDFFLLHLKKMEFSSKMCGRAYFLDIISIDKTQKISAIIQNKILHHSNLFSGTIFENCHSSTSLTDAPINLVH